MSETRDYESEATEEGWLPKEAFVEKFGSDARWVDAETFVRRGEEILPIVNAKNRKLQDELASVRSELSQVRETTVQFKQFHDKALEREKAEKERLIVELEAIRAKAVTEGDAKAFTDADRKLTEARKEPVVPQRREPSAAMVQWRADNKWYGEDYAMTAAMDGVSERVGQSQRWPNEIAFLEACKAEAMKVFPEAFKNPNRQTGKVEDPRGSKPNGRGRTFGDLPDDAKAAFENFKRLMPKMTEEEYLKNYVWE